MDDPQNRLVPGSRTLQALRVFANQASTALDAAAQFEEMRFLADHDPLTRLLNRRVFSERLAGETARHVRYARPFALIVCDLDGFKQLNDARGHQAGDAALEAFAELLADGRREVDGVFRIGGDEFALLLPEAGDGRGAGRGRPRARGDALEPRRAAGRSAAELRRRRVPRGRRRSARAVSRGRPGDVRRQGAAPPRSRLTRPAVLPA